MQLEEFTKEVPVLDSTMKRIEYLQQNPKLRDVFLYGGDHGGKKFKGMGMTATAPDGTEVRISEDKASFERKFFPAAKDMLTAGSPTDLNLKAAYKTLPELRDADVEFKMIDTELDTLSPSRLAERNRRLTNVVEKQQIENQKGADFSVVNSAMSQGLAESGLSGFDQMIARSSFLARTWLGGQDPAEAASTVLSGWEGYQGKRIEANSRFTDKSYMENERGIQSRLRTLREEIQNGGQLAPQQADPAVKAALDKQNQLMERQTHVLEQIRDDGRGKRPAMVRQPAAERN